MRYQIPFYVGLTRLFNPRAFDSSAAVFGSITYTDAQLIAQAQQMGIRYEWNSPEFGAPEELVIAFSGPEQKQAFYNALRYTNWATVYAATVPAEVRYYVEHPSPSIWWGENDRSMGIDAKTGATVGMSHFVVDVDDAGIDIGLPTYVADKYPQLRASWIQKPVVEKDLMGDAILLGLTAYVGGVFTAGATGLIGAATSSQFVPTTVAAIEATEASIVAGADALVASIAPEAVAGGTALTAAESAAIVEAATAGEFVPTTVEAIEATEAAIVQGAESIVPVATTPAATAETFLDPWDLQPDKFIEYQAPHVIDYAPITSAFELPNIPSNLPSIAQKAASLISTLLKGGGTAPPRAPQLAPVPVVRQAGIEDSGGLGLLALLAVVAATRKPRR